MIATTTTTTPDWLPVLVVLAPAVTGLLGVLATLRVEAGRRRAVKEQEEGARHEERSRRAADYQRETLQDLQVALVELLESTFEIVWPGEREVTIEDRKRQYRASARVTMLTQRVVDDGVREAVNAAAAAIEEVLLSDDPTGESTRDAMTLQDVAQGVIGEALRGLA